MLAPRPIRLPSKRRDLTPVDAPVRAVAAKHLSLSGTRALVLGGTGPVGQRVGLLLGLQGAEVRLASRQDRLGEGDTPTGGHAVVNLGVGTSIVRGGMASHVSLHVDNALNTAYRDHLSVIKDFLPQPGRGVRVTYALTY